MGLTNLRGCLRRRRRTRSAPTGMMTETLTSEVCPTCLTDMGRCSCPRQASDQRIEPPGLQEPTSMANCPPTAFGPTGGLSTAISDGISTGISTAISRGISMDLSTDMQSSAVFGVNGPTDHQANPCYRQHGQYPPTAQTPNRRVHLATME